jgi:hypothetical protein
MSKRNIANHIYMAFSKFSAKGMTPIEMVLLVVFVVYVIFPVKTPQWFAPYVDNPLGILFMFLITVYLFVYLNPILGVLYIFVAYELLRRSATVMGGNSTVNYAINQPSALTQANKDAQLARMNPPAPSPVNRTLEEDVVAKMAPVPNGAVNDAGDSSFKPVYDLVVGASLV